MFLARADTDDELLAKFGTIILSTVHNPNRDRSSVTVVAKASLQLAFEV